MARSYSWPAPTSGPLLLLARSYFWPAPTPGPLLLLARSYSWPAPTPGPLLLLARSYSWPTPTRPAATPGNMLSNSADYLRLWTSWTDVSDHSCNEERTSRWRWIVLYSYSRRITSSFQCHATNLQKVSWITWNSGIAPTFAARVSCYPRIFIIRCRTCYSFSNTRYITIQFIVPNYATRDDKSSPWEAERQRL